MNVARSLIALGDDSDVIPHLDRARTVFAEIGDRYNQARASLELGSLRLNAGEPAEARRILSAALGVMVDLDAKYEQARIHEQLCAVATAMRTDESARRHLERAAELYESTGSPLAERIRRRLTGS
ncbi:hypothetical protein CLV40_1161 [Actinokineospora auranticolor]|uniref:Tetratricopeptide repeat protein n=1 Tax=Actinokineospora auranticolor TaxID=155976 RepID=A0A2S6GIB3_9PSEU|nr:hypothetical protein CLV40_1161 [Actinokineospora auranticolor]